MERKILGIKPKDRVPCREIRARTNVVDIVKYVEKQKWKWAGHVARLQDDRWTQRVTEWKPRHRRSRGRQIQRWQDDIVQRKGTTWEQDVRQRERLQDSAEGYVLQWMNKVS
ncbi:endonuclease-reverse transcriptase [Elysia marginata]|uniref:Endonuclease-reverse transcriptase n=1 Tax=Elysia marginata TaxID=1093978 RepID=A0AAV4J8J3_9GAST|nr:endonuclease-reverse transcriptase [Elysia marginata]